jgi:hypothetical protein
MSYLEELEKFLHDENKEDFCEYVRINYEWNDEEFQKLIKLLEAVLIEIQDEDYIPRWLASYFASTPDLIIGISSHPQFIKNLERKGRIENVQEFFDTRHKQLKRLKFWFFNGVKPPETLF